jgi:hypothetical protein
MIAVSMASRSLVSLAFPVPIKGIESGIETLSACGIVTGVTLTGCVIRMSCDVKLQLIQIILKVQKRLIFISVLLRHIIHKKSPKGG